MTTAKSIYFILIAMIVGIVAVFFYYNIPFKFEYIGAKEKIWAHRVNSIEKLNYSQGKYYGIELDIVFDARDNAFDVNHPPAQSIGLTLEIYFSNLDAQHATGIWLDFKNLNAENKDYALKKLQSLTDKFSLKRNHIIVESQYPEYLQDFRKAGFLTSYYLPSGLHTLSSKNLTKKISDIEMIIKAHPTTAISTNIDDYIIIKKYFPKLKKYLWSLKTTYSFSFISNYKLTKKVLQDPMVTILLVRVNSKIGQR